MGQNRRLSFKIEKLDSTEKVLEEKSLQLVDGSIDVGSGGFRRKCSFTLLEALPDDWQSYRWKLYYGYSEDFISDPIFTPLGVYIPINPSSQEVNGRSVVKYQGVDKVKLFADYEIDTPITFTAPMDVKDIILQVAGWFNETKFNLGDSLGTIQVDRTFEEGTTAQSILDTITSSFGDDWFYDINGYLVAREQVDASVRAIKQVMDDESTPIYINASTDFDDSNYYNKVTVVGGTADTPIYRSTVQNNAAITLAGGRIVQKYFSIDGAVTQDQVDGRATFYLSGGVQIPATLNLDSLVIPDLEIGDILMKDSVRYETRSFNVPLSTAIQTIKAGKVM